jgi:hypothetical protein
MSVQKGLGKRIQLFYNLRFAKQRPAWRSAERSKAVTLEVVKGAVKRGCKSG